MFDLHSPAFVTLMTFASFPALAVFAVWLDDFVKRWKNGDGV